jgi:hypothetical protein
MGEATIMGRRKGKNDTPARRIVTGSIHLQQNSGEI